MSFDIHPFHFHLNFVQNISPVWSVISPLTRTLFRNALCFISKRLWNFPDIFVKFISNLIPVWSEEIVYIILILSILLRIVLGHDVAALRCMSHVRLERMRPAVPGRRGPERWPTVSPTPTAASAQAAATEPHSLGGVNDGSLFLHSSGG